ncbi:GNAT family N-acetyltransferase [Humibacter ginsenosidimutans]|uniref:GNAT family N-acetyltransferase n=1 Tax=Humibacter ginsenosidimutans TaxID=2599293 RepID=A0A5B8M4X8_9MICO|nr:GNAT family N-acetyltransferase [Humibacter ginsenosidimutans]
MRRLLAAWRERLARASIPAHGESAAVLSWASRDAAVVKVLRNSGFTPTAVLAARVGAARPGPETTMVTVRAIAPSDVETVTSLHETLIRWDDNFGGAHWRASTPARMHDYVTELITGPRPRAWVAEVDGHVVGSCDVEWPETAGWATGGIAADPATVAYIGTMSVAPGIRGTGIGSALIAHVHRELSASGISLPVLHYAPLNPLSAPFWHRAGYRPVTTTWTAQPHTVLRDGRAG